MRQTGNRAPLAGTCRLLNLTALENEMVSHAAAGEVLDRGEGPFELRQMDRWGPDRTVRAEVLRCLLVGTDPVAPKGVRLRGIKILGHLDLEAATIRCPLRLDSCYLDGPTPDFGFATVSLLELTNCHMDGLDAESIRVRKDLDLSGSTFSSPIELGGADITGWFVCTDAKLNGKSADGRALIGFGMKVGGNVCLDHGFTAAGMIQLIGADITGQLNCTGACLKGKDGEGRSLVADRVKVGRGVHFSDGFTAAGALRLPGANIKSALTCRGAHLNGRDDEGRALSAFTAKIDGDLILEKVYTAIGAIDIYGAHITGRLRCQGARLDGTNGNDSALVAFRMTVGTDVWLNNVTTTNGAIRLTGAKITGQLSCQDSQLNGRDKDGKALVADGMTVGGGLAFTDVRITRGAISMAGAQITGDLRWVNVHLDGLDGNRNALIANSVKVGGDLAIHKMFTTAGAIRLPGTRITGRLMCSASTLKGHDRDGRVLLADGLIASGAWIGSVRTACGCIRMTGAEIAGDLRCQGLRLNGADENGRALVANRIKVGGSMILESSEPIYEDPEFIADGTLSLRSARIGGSLQFKPGKLAGGQDAAGQQKVALDLAGAQIGHELEWAPASAVTGKVILEDTKVALLKDNLKLEPKGRWPSASDGLLRLDGFTYNRICDEPQAQPKERLEWIGSPYKPAPRNEQRIFTTQPYEQLAAVYRRAGQDNEARNVCIARRRDLRRYGDLIGYRRWGNWLLDISIRYGYRTWRAVAALGVLYLAALVIFLLAQQHPGTLIPVMAPPALHPVPDAAHCTSSYPCFYPAAYAVDTVIPIINVHQATFWGPNGHAPLGYVLSLFTWISIVAGWALTTLAVAGYTGLVRRD